MATGSTTETTSLPSNATGTSDEIGVRPGEQLTVHTSVLSTGSPVIAFTMEVYNNALGAWETFADATSKLSDGDAAAGAASNVSNFENPPLGLIRIKGTNSADGSATAATMVIVIERGRKGL